MFLSFFGKEGAHFLSFSASWLEVTFADIFLEERTLRNGQMHIMLERSISAVYSDGSHTAYRKMS